MAPGTKLLSPNLLNARNELALLQQILGLGSAATFDVRFQDAVFVCVDCEAFERAQNIVTEIGVTVLDTKDIAGLEPRENCMKWFEKMKFAHYRPLQHAKFLNRRWVHGCEESFSFGQTTWINLEDSALVLGRIFLDPSRLERVADFDVEITDQKRNIILVGHDFRGDRTYMNKLGFSLSSATNVARTFDTQLVAGSGKKKPVSLQRLLLSLGMEPVDLHNGGNDAAYTVQALITMAVNDYRQPGSVFSGLEACDGKLPPITHANLKARHVYGGTAKASIDSQGLADESVVPVQSTD